MVAWHTLCPSYLRDGSHVRFIPQQKRSERDQRMSGVLGILGVSELPSNQQVRRMLAAMNDRGSDIQGLWRDQASVLGITRHPWECDVEFSGHVTVVEADGYVVAADATLYYKKELRRKLATRGVMVDSENPSRLILAAYKAWGDDCIDHLDGDFAFVVLERRSGAFFSARDFAGTRPLFHGQFGQTTVIASSIGALLAYPSCTGELNMAAVGEAAAGLHSSSSVSTCYRGINTVPAGHFLKGRPPAAPVLTRYWRPVIRAGRENLRTAAEQLHEMLCASVEERMPSSSRSALGLNGDWPSYAVFGIGQHVLARNGTSPGRLVPVSIPSGNGGLSAKRTAAQWNTAVHWVDKDTALALEDPTIQHDPLVLGFESHTSALTRACRMTGARVMIDGVGGDRLFVGSAILLADYLSRGRWFNLIRHHRVAGPGLRNFLRWSLHPYLPVTPRDGSWFRRRDSVSHYLSDRIPDWVDRRFARRYQLNDRAKYRADRPVGTTHASYELLWTLTTPANGRLFSAIHTLGLLNGVEVRFPLFDRRIVEFMVTRPPIDRADSGRVLRHALRDLLPAEAPQPEAYGPTNPSQYVHRVLAYGISTVLEDTSRLELAREGIVRAGSLEAAVRRYRRRKDDKLALSLYRTIQTELWLRAKRRPDESAAAVPIKERRRQRQRPIRASNPKLQVAG